MKLDDIVALAKAGYTPKQVKELFEMVETSPQVKEATPEQVVSVDTTKDNAPKTEVEDDPIEALKKMLNKED